MSSVETGQMSAVETGQMSAAETGQMSAVETRQMSTIETGLCPVSIFYICLVSTANICPVSAGDICPASTADICTVSTEDICPAQRADIKSWPAEAAIAADNHWSRGGVSEKVHHRRQGGVSVTKPETSYLANPHMKVLGACGYFIPGSLTRNSLANVKRF